MWGDIDSGIVGRARELAEIVAALDDPACRGIALVGPAGVGKSRLAEAVRQLAARQAMTVVTAIATPASQTITLGALTHLLPPATTHGEDIAGLHDSLRPTQLLRAAQSALTEMADGGRLLLAVDDAHLLDPVSAHLIGQLAAHATALLVVTVRSGERTPEAVTTLWKDEIVRRIDLGPFDAAATAALAASLLGAPLDARAASWLFRTSAGNALFARELVLGAAETGALTRADTTWTLTDARSTVSPRLTELVEQRLAGLTTDERRALDLVALAEPIGLDLASQIAGEDAIAALDQHGLLQVVMSGHRVELRPAHPLYGEALRQRPITLRRRSDLLALIRTIDDLGARRRDDAVRVAMLRLATGEPVDPEVLLRAAVAAQQGFDDAGAIRLTDIAFAQQGTSGEITAGLRFCAATSLARLGEFGRADALLALAAADETDEEQRNRIAVRRAFTRSEAADDLDGAVAILEDALATTTTPERRDGLGFDLATLLADGGRSAQAAAVLSRHDTVPDDPALRLSHLLARSATLCATAQWTDAMASAVEGYEYHLAHPDADSSFHPSSQLWYRYTSQQRGGWTADAQAGVESFITAAASEGRPIGLCVARTMLSRLLLDRGRLTEASASAEQAFDGWTPSMQPYLRRWALAAMAMIATARGDITTAQRHVDELLRDADRPRVRMSAGMSAVETALAPVVVAHAAGRRSAARAALRHEIARAETDGDPSTLHELLTQDCRLFATRSSATRLLRVLDEIDPAAPLVSCERAVAEATLTGDHERWAEAAALYAAIDHLWPAALVWRIAADAATASGHTRSAVAHRRSAADVLARCTGVDGAGSDAPRGLTDRELEIARLVAAGATSKDVAAQLVVSARTVDNHLQRIYAKLGVSGRRDLAAALGIT